MNSYGEFFLEFMTPFFNGLLNIIKSLFIELFNMFNIFGYIDVVNKYAKEMGGFGIIVVIISGLCLIALFGVVIFFIVRGIRKYLTYRRNKARQESLVEEVENLNMDVLRLRQENQKFLSMVDGMETGIEFDEDGNVVKLQEGESRFYKLTKVDEEMENHSLVPAANNLTLQEICDKFRNYAASELGLYYSNKIIRLFVSSFASNRLIILQGISGTGKTSLAYAYGEFLGSESVIASVQPSWRDSTELLGYFNEFTKRFNETELLKKMYEAAYKKDVYITVLDEMNISRVEYYFAEMLSLLELPDQDDWMVSLVSNGWDNDPKLLKDGRFKIPVNMWYVGTINNDDSTFMVTDKVYDRAMPIEINEKHEKFVVEKVDKISVDYDYMNKLYEDAWQKYPLSQTIKDKLRVMDDYNIEHFRISFGNRVSKQMEELIPVYVASGGTEIEAVDYLITYKILRKFNQLNSSLIKNELEAYIEFMSNLFGKENIPECLAYLERFKRLG